MASHISYSQGVRPKRGWLASYPSGLVRRATYLRKSGFGSAMPALRMAALFGTQYQNAALLVVPPMLPAFSRITALLPCHRANSADARPPQPLPQTTMSYSPSNLGSAASARSVARPKPAAATAADPAPALLMKRRRD